MSLDNFERTARQALWLRGDTPKRPIAGAAARPKFSGMSWILTIERTSANRGEQIYSSTGARPRFVNAISVSPKRAIVEDCGADIVVGAGYRSRVDVDGPVLTRTFARECGMFFTM